MWCRVLVGVFVSAALSAPAAADDRGWGYLIDKLIADGLDRGRVVRTFEDPRLGKFTGIKFSASRPHERRSLYRRFLRPRSVVAARPSKTPSARRASPPTCSRRSYSSKPAAAGMPALTSC
jgi:hypothetical protein